MLAVAWSTIFDDFGQKSDLDLTQNRPKTAKKPIYGRLSCKNRRSRFFAKSVILPLRPRVI